MDALDVAILRAMGVGPPGAAAFDLDALKPARIAERVGLSLPAAKERLRNLERAGALEGYLPLVNPRTYGCDAGVFLFEIDEMRKAVSLASLEDRREVAGFIDFAGPWAYVFLIWLDEADRERRLGVVADIVGKPPRATPYRHPNARIERAPTALDLRLLLALFPDALRDPSEIARAVGVTARTVKTRLARLRRERVYQVRPLVDRANLPGLVFLHLLVEAEPGRERECSRATLDLLEGEILFAPQPPGRDAACFDVGLCVDTLAKAETRRAAVARLPGVANALALFPRRAHDHPAEIREALAGALDRAAAREGFQD